MKDLQRNKKNKIRKKKSRTYSPPMEYYEDSEEENQEQHTSSNEVNFDNIQSNSVGSSMHSMRDNDLSVFAKNINLDRNLFYSDSRENIRFSKTDEYNSKVSDRFFQTYKKEQDYQKQIKSPLLGSSIPNNTHHKTYSENESTRWQTPFNSSKILVDRLPTISTYRNSTDSSEEKNKIPQKNQSESYKDKFDPSDY